MSLLVGARQAVIMPRPAIIIPGSSYDGDAAEYFARHGVQEASGWKDAVNAFVLGVKADGDWTDLDRIGLFAVNTLGNALYDLRDETKSYTQTGAAGLTLQTGVGGGIKADGASGLSAGEAITAGANYRKDDALWWVSVIQGNDALTAAPPIFGTVTNTGRALGFAGSEAVSGTAIGGRVNSTTTDSGAFTQTSRIGRVAGGRFDATNAHYFRNGTSASSPQAKTSADPTADAWCLLQSATTYASDDLVIDMAIVGRAGTGADATSLAARVARLDARYVTLRAALDAL